MLRDQTAIVTGGGTGIGRGVALALARAGCKVMVCGRRAAPLQDTVDEIRSAGGQADFITADMAQEKDILTVVEKTKARFGSLHILINNAAVYLGEESDQLPVDAWDQTMAVNLRGPYLLIRAALPEMRAQRSGHIINISSESGLNYYRNDLIYGLSKHALNDLGEYIQQENQDFNIRVNTICPGMVVTPMSEGSASLDRSK